MPETAERSLSSDREMVRRLLWAAFIAAVVVGCVLRFWTRSDLWLDEALTVDIARQPLHLLDFYLRRDGAPPLFYALLHVWMGVFGTSDVAVRALPGLFGVLTVPVVWVVARKVSTRGVAAAAVLLVVSSPFAIRYDTETRMYSLVTLLSALGLWALLCVLERPSPRSVASLALCSAALLYSHYWSIYLLGVTGLLLLWRARPGAEEGTREARWAIAAIAAGFVAFVPWVPTFVYQSQHTGTPWAQPATFDAMVNVVTTFAGGISNQGRLLALFYFALAGLGLFGIATDARHITLDLRTRPIGRPFTIVVFGTLTAAILGGLLSHSAFSDRYASVVFVPLEILVALGTATFASRNVRIGVVAVATLAGFLGSVPNVWTNRTEAGQVARALNAQASPGDVVAYCPDQLGPAVYRLAHGGGLQQITFPRGTGPEFVNWVDYAQASKAGDPAAFASSLVQRAGTHRIWLVWAVGYETFGTDCEQIVQHLDALPGYTSRSIVTEHSRYYQPMALSEYTPSG